MQGTFDIGTNCLLFKIKFVFSITRHWPKWDPPVETLKKRRMNLSIICSRTSDFKIWGKIPHRYVGRYSLSILSFYFLHSLSPPTSPPSCSLPNFLSLTLKFLFHSNSSNYSPTNTNTHSPSLNRSLMGSTLNREPTKAQATKKWISSISRSPEKPFLKYFFRSFSVPNSIVLKKYLAQK